MTSRDAAKPFQRRGFRHVLCPCCGGRIGFKLYCPKCKVNYA